MEQRVAGFGRLRRVGRVALLSALLSFGCEPAAPPSADVVAQAPPARADFVALVDRLSEAGGYFDTDNLISNETGYLKVIDALHERGISGGAYIGVGPDQNFSYIAAVRPEIAFITDIRRDNLLHHLLLKVLIERAPTRVEFLASLVGAEPPEDPSAWVDRDAAAIVEVVEAAWPGSGAPERARAAALFADVERRIRGIGLDLADEELETVRRFHTEFMRAGTGLRFTSFGRPPRPYYPTYRQLVLETDVDGDPASYLATEEAYRVVRDLQLADRVVPVVGDLSGSGALQGIAEVLREMDLEVSAIYASNVEFYLWQDRTFDGWVANVRSLPAAESAVVVRSYFPNFGRAHPSSIPGYHATQTLQPLATLAGGGFASYWDVVTRDALPLR